MRLFEIALVATLFIILVGKLWPHSRRPRALSYAPGASALVMALQLLIEGYRWSMVPAYALTLVFAVPFAIRLARGHLRADNLGVTSARGRRVWQIIRVACVLLIGLPVILLAAALPASFPVADMPAPTGPYAIGTTSLELVDTRRDDPLAGKPGTKRALQVQVWYPASVSEDAARTSFFGGTRYFRLLTEYFEMPGFLFDHLAMVRTNSVQDAALATADGAFPIIVFSHGYVGHVMQNTLQMEELASHGYVVFSIAHPYEAMLVSYPDGRELPYSKERVDVFFAQSMESGDEWEAFRTAKDEEARLAAFKTYLKAMPIFMESAEIWVADTRFVLDEIERLNRDDARFAGKLDLGRIGVMGMSFGGCIVSEVCLQDSRCKAGVALDSPQVGGVLDGELNTPILLMLNEDSGSFVNTYMLSRNRAATYRISVAGTAHMDYSDFILISPLFRYTDFLGTIESERINEITNRYLLAFFGKHLLGKEGEHAALLAGPAAAYPEVKFEAVNHLGNKTASTAN